MNENIENKFENVREKVIFSLLAIWMLIPILKDMQITRNITLKYEFTFIIIAGMIGLFFLVFDIFKNAKKGKNNEEYVKEILPITILGIFMVWTFISCLCSDNQYNAFLGTSYRKDGYLTYIAYAGFFSCAFFIKSKRNKNLLINLFIVVAILNIIISELYNKSVFTNIFADLHTDITCFWHFNHYGYYLLLATVTSFFLCVTQKNKVIKILYLISYMFLLYYLIINNTFGCYVALTLTLIFFVIYSIYMKKNRLITLFLVIIFVGMSFGIPKTRAIVMKNIDYLVIDINKIVKAEQIKLQEEYEVEKETIQNEINNKKINKTSKKEIAIKIADKAGTGRVALWRNAINFFLERPILGYGPENLGEKYAKLNIFQDRPHNLFLQLATTSGIIGVVTYVTAIGIILIRGVKTMKMENSIHVVAMANVVAYLISAMFGNSMYYTSPYFFIFLGILMCESIKVKKNKELKDFTK